MPDRQAAQAALDKMQETYEECSMLLPSVLKARRRTPKHACPRWAEAGRELLSVLGKVVASFGERVATQLSDVEFRTSSAQVLAVEEAEHHTVMLFQGLLEMMRLYLHLAPEVLVVEAPAQAVAAAV